VSNGAVVNNNSNNNNNKRNNKYNNNYFVPYTDEEIRIDVRTE
jgi:hypothetical protein